MTPKPPERAVAPRPGGIARPSTQLPVARDEVAPGAVHSYTPPASPDTAITLPPPRDPRPPPRALRGSSSGVRVPPLDAPSLPKADESGEPTLHGVAPPSVRPEREDGDRDSTVEAINSAEALAAELAKRNARVAELERELARRDVKPEKLVAPEEKPPTWKQWQVALFKVIVPLGALLTAFASYIGVHTATTLPPKIENQEAKQKAVEVTAESDHEQLVKLRAFVQAEQAYRDCLDAQRDSAIRRGTGHRVTSDTDSTEWLEQSMPLRRAPLIWERAIWYPATPCMAKPKAP